MELDEMKNLWEKTNKIAEKTKISEGKIIEMLRKSYKGAMNSLLSLEILGLIIILPCATIIYCMFSFWNLNAIYGVEVLKWTFIALCIIGFFWQGYKYKFLKGIKIAEMNILEVSQKVLRYRKYIINEAIAGTIFFIIFMIPLMYFVYTFRFGNEIIFPLIIYYATIFALGVLMILFLYKKLYFNNIKKIQESLAEIEEFQKEIDE